MVLALLDGYRCLDLTDEKGMVCGSIFAELGAEVIKVEKVGGDPARNIGPFYHDIPHPEKSLFWFAYNINKKSITLNIETGDGQEIFKRLVKNVDCIFESFPPGYMENLGLGYSSLCNVNPKIIMTSITPFGQFGAYSNCEASDICVLAQSGLMSICGDSDRPPLQIYPPQVYFMGSLSAAVGTIIALYHRGISGEGQWVDASALDSVVMSSPVTLAFWDALGEVVHRSGRLRRRGTTYITMLWPCKDGHVTFALLVGHMGARLAPLVKWMDNEGLAGPLAKIEDWTAVDMLKISPEELKGWEEAFGNFFLRHTKAELSQFSQEHGIYLMPGQTPREIVEDPHLAARHFWIEVEHPELSTLIRYPGPPYRFSEVPHVQYKRAPLIGEHNQSIYKEELGLSTEELIALKESNVI